MARRPLQLLVQAHLPLILSLHDGGVKAARRRVNAVLVEGGLYVAVKHSMVRHEVRTLQCRQDGDRAWVDDLRQACVGCHPSILALRRVGVHVAFLRRG